MNNVFRPVNPVFDRNMFIFQVTAFRNQAEYEKNIVFFSPLCVFNT